MSQSKRTWRRRIGRVTVYLRGSRYWIYYRQGKQVRRPVGTNKEEALALAAKINAQLAEGAPTILAFQPIAVDALVAKWLDHHEHVRRSSLATVRRYRTAVGHLAGFVQRDFGKLRADRFDSSKAEDFVRHLRKAEVSPNGHANTQRRRMRDKGTQQIMPCRSRQALRLNRRIGGPAKLLERQVFSPPPRVPLRSASAACVQGTDD